MIYIRMGMKFHSWLQRPRPPAKTLGTTLLFALIYVHKVCLVASHTYYTMYTVLVTCFHFSLCTYLPIMMGLLVAASAEQTVSMANCKIFILQQTTIRTQHPLRSSGMQWLLLQVASCWFNQCKENQVSWIKHTRVQNVLFTLLAFLQSDWICNYIYRVT